MLEFQLTPNSISTIHIWLSALLGTSFLLTIFLLLHFARVRFLLGPRFHRFSRLLLAVLASLQIFAWQLYHYSESHDTVALWCFPLALLGGGLLWRFSNGSLTVHPFYSRSLPVALCLASFVEFAGFAQATRQFSGTAQLCDVSTVVSNFSNPGSLVEKTTIYGKTDCGKPIKLFKRQITDGAFRNYVEKCRSFSSVSEKAMLRAQPFAQSNCHGWVFTQGQHILRGEDVQLILDDNNYAKVANPQNNDVAVYRSSEGDIVHTGVVRGSLETATIVESKWGIGALYMHIAEEQPYSQNITYYRSERPSHEIFIANTDRTSELAAELLLLADQAIDDRVKRSFFDTHFCSSQCE